ncbi:MAG TPA: hypothetical protein VKT82_08420 [Ktedonobacterales bacterium]|nr:hypothetical protein [Ktedonobacterales bacterium]
MIPDHLRIQPGQQALTPEQEAEARRFAEERIQAQLSTEPVDEQEAGALLRQAYEVAGLAAPQRIQWVDGPLQLVAVLAPPSVRDSVSASVDAGALLSVGESVVNSISASVRGRVEESVGESVEERVWSSVEESVWISVRDSVSASVGDRVRDSVRDRVWRSIWAYDNAPGLAFYHFFDVYLAPNALRALACFNERVSAYWLGEALAVIVRRPRVLARDQEGHLHNASGKCIGYHDGWGLYAWHGVLVPEQVILAPETLTREDFLNQRNLETRRVIQERMGSRFVPELGGIVLDSGPRGTLYEVRLPADDPEGVARYVQVQDTSKERQYFLRVPPTIQTAAEAVAWSFGLSGEGYHPERET